MVRHGWRLTALLIAVGAEWGGTEVDAADTPHIVVIVADDLGKADLGYRGSPTLTPTRPSSPWRTSPR
jgi:hypothetical protein